MTPFEWTEHAPDGAHFGAQALKCDCCEYAALLIVTLRSGVRAGLKLMLCRVCLGRLRATLKAGEKAVNEKMLAIPRSVRIKVAR